MPGIKGQKWGVRRFQNEDGTLTEEGKRRYGTTDAHTGNKTKSNVGKSIQKHIENAYKKRDDRSNKKIDDAGLGKRISEKDKKIFSSYSESSQKQIIKYMQTHPKATFNEADRAETKKSIIKGLVGLGVSLGATAYLYSKMNKRIEAACNKPIKSAFESDYGKSICMTGKEYISMVNNRRKLFSDP